MGDIPLRIHTVNLMELSGRRLGGSTARARIRVQSGNAARSRFNVQEPQIPHHVFIQLNIQPCGRLR